MSTSQIRPRIVLCLLHDRPEVIEALCVDSGAYTYDAQYSDAGPDERMPRAFEHSWDRVCPSATAEDTAAILAHRNVSYALSRPLTPDTAQQLAADGLSLIARAFAEGARAVKCESSGIAHGRSQWLEFAGRSDPARLYFSYVRRPIDADLRMYSCGMHLLGLPDTSVLGFPDREASRIIDLFSLYQLLDGGHRRLQPGHTFTPSPQDPPLTLDKVPCTGYAEDEFFYNPYGLWNLERKNEYP